MLRDCTLTVITPVFNGIRHIEACLDNVRAQACDSVEHLIVDGGSTDGTVDFIRDRMRSDPAVRLLEGPDRGQSNAMNKGVMAARAPLLGCLNVDDHYLPGTLARAIALLQGAPEPSFLWGACKVRDHLHGGEYVQYPGRFVPWRMALGWNVEPHPINPVAYFYHRKLHFDAGFFDENEHYALDLKFLLRASSHVRSVITTREILGVYELAPDTKTYNDAKSGGNVERNRQVFSRFRAELPFADRARLAALKLRRRLS
jgi:glycosyltransferase involved in cell wall biosynthesis